MKLPFRLALLAITSVLLLSSAGLYAQGSGQRQRVHPALETLGDGPIAPSFRSPMMMLSPQEDFGDFHSVQVNVDGSGHNIPGDAANEPSLTMSPSGRHRMAIGWRQFNSVASNFRQAGYGYTANGGASWSFPGILEQNVFRSDPVLDSDADAQFFYLSLKQTFYDDIWSSITGGSAWSRLGDATGGDKQWMAIDRSNSTGRGFIYQAWSTAGNNYGGRQFSRSTNGGVTWMSPIFIPNRPVWGTLDVASNGDLYLCGEGSTSFYFVKSTNAKNAAVTPTFTTVAVNMGGSMAYGQAVNPGGLSGQMWVACDKSTGLPTSGNIYMLCSVERNAANPCDVMFVRSTNGGQTWSSPVRLNDDPVDQGRYHWFGTLSVAPNGRIDTIWYDSRGDATNTLSAMYYSCSFDGGLTWSPDQQVSPTFNPHLGYPNQNKLGDYIGMVSDIGGANIAYAATFNGEEDVYYLRIPVSPRYAISADSVSMFEGKSWEGTLSAIWNIDGLTYLTAPIMTSRGPLASVQVDYTAPADAVNDLWLTTHTLQGADCLVETFLYNWTTGVYDPLGAAYVSSVNRDTKFALQGDPTPYIGAGRKVRAVVRELFATDMRPAKGILRLDRAQLLMN